MCHVEKSVSMKRSPTSLKDFGSFPYSSALMALKGSLCTPVISFFAFEQSLTLLLSGNGKVFSVVAHVRAKGQLVRDNLRIDCGGF